MSEEHCSEEIPGSRITLITAGEMIAAAPLVLGREAATFIKWVRQLTEGDESRVVGQIIERGLLIEPGPRRRLFLDKVLRVAAYLLLAPPPPPTPLRPA